MVGAIGDLGRAVLFYEGFRLFFRASHRAGFRDINAICVLHQRAFADGRILHIELLEALEFCFCRIRESEQGLGRIRISVKVKIDRREVFDIVCGGIGVDVERVVRHFVRVTIVATAVNRAVDRVACRHGARAVAEVDRIAGYLACTVGMTAFDARHDAALDGDNVVFYIAVFIGIAAVDHSRMTIFDRRLIMEHVAVLSGCCYAAVDGSCIAALEECCIVLDDSCAGAFRHAAD